MNKKKIVILVDSMKILDSKTYRKVASAALLNNGQQNFFLNSIGSQIVNKYFIMCGNACGFDLINIPCQIKKIKLVLKENGLNNESIIYFHLNFTFVKQFFKSSEKGWKNASIFMFS